MDQIRDEGILSATTRVVAAQAQSGMVRPDEIPKLIKDVHAAFEKCVPKRKGK